MGLLGASLPVTVCQILIVVEVGQELFEVNLGPVLHPALAPHSHDSWHFFLNVVDPRVGLVTQRGVGGQVLGIRRQEDAIFWPLAGCGDVVGDELLCCIATLLIANEYSKDFHSIATMGTSGTSWLSGTRGTRRSGLPELEALAQTLSDMDPMSRT